MTWWVLFVVFVEGSGTVRDMPARVFDREEHCQRWVNMIHEMGPASFMRDTTTDVRGYTTGCIRLDSEADA